MNVLPAIDEVLTYTGVEPPVRVRVVQLDDRDEVGVLIESVATGMRIWVHPGNLRREP
jgi:hypothetical protein